MEKEQTQIYTYKDKEFDIFQIVTFQFQFFFAPLSGYGCCSVSTVHISDSSVLRPL